MTSTHKEKATFGEAAFQNNLEDESYKSEAKKQEKTAGAAYTVDHLRPITSRVRTDITAIKTPDGASIWKRDEPLTSERIQAHLSGKCLRGVCPIKEAESSTMVLLLDFDSHKGETSWEDMLGVAQVLYEAFAAIGIHLEMFISSGGKGIHAFGIWQDPQDAYSVRQVAMDVLESVGYRNGTGGVAKGEIEVFPKQNEIKIGGCGNQFILPFSPKGKPLGTLEWKLMELIGYTLVSHARFEIFVLLIGAGANGKSVLLDVIRLMVGMLNVSAVQPSQFGNKFQRAHLHGKLANLVTEIPEGAEIADAELKAIVSGELTTAEHKNKPPFDFRPFCTCWFGTNHMPHTRDFSDALFRRAKVIMFNRTFKYGVDADPHLKDKLAGELPGIITLSLHAFGDVLKRKMFTEPESCAKAKQEWRIEADQVAQFVGEVCIVESDAKITSDELYKHYKTWADEAGVTRKLNRKNFTTRTMRLGGKPCKGTGGKRMIAGIRVKSPYEHE
jgi:P4 family phage/plasmid primase-like protien